MIPLAQIAFAHRGLWSVGGPAENSLAAFSAAAKAGVGAELDVQITADGHALVFHDAEIRSPPGEIARVSELRLPQLRTLRLADGSSPPILEEALEVLSNAKGVLVEVKPAGDAEKTRTLVEIVADTIRSQPHRIAGMSFDLNAARHLKTLLPDSAVGLLIEPEPFIGADAVHTRVASALAWSLDFVAPHLTSIETASVATHGRLPMATWTISHPDLLGIATRFGAVPIFEGMSPALAIGAIQPI